MCRQIRRRLRLAHPAPHTPPRSRRRCAHPLVQRCASASGGRGGQGCGHVAGGTLNDSSNCWGELPSFDEAPSRITGSSAEPSRLACACQALTARLPATQQPLAHPPQTPAAAELPPRLTCIMSNTRSPGSLVPATISRLSGVHWILQMPSRCERPPVLGKRTVG